MHKGKVETRQRWVYLLPILLIACGGSEEVAQTEEDIRFRAYRAFRPNLKVDIEPFEAGSSVYLPLAPTTAGGTEQAKIVLRLRIENEGTTTTKINKIEFSFPYSTHPKVTMQGVNLTGRLDLAPGDAEYWSNGRVDLDLDPDATNWINNAVFLNLPAPQQIRVTVFAQGFLLGKSVTLPLAPHNSPTPQGSYRMPYAAGELRTGEFYETSGVHWANGGAKGSQIFAHDIGVVGYDAATGNWSSVLPGTAGDQNDHFRIWNKPLRAMADGVIVDWHDGMDDNTVIGEFPDPTPSPVAGNHLWIQHGTEVIRYAHFKKNTIPAALKVVGAPVSEGQYLGRVGNSGNSSAPHTHVEVLSGSKSGPLRPMPFHSAWVIDRAQLSMPSASGPWAKLNDQGIPKNKVLIWPASTTPGEKIPTIGVSQGGTWANSYWISNSLTSFSQTAQSLFDNHGRRLTHVTTYVENGQRKWVGIARSGNWANRWWISNSLASFQATAQAHFDRSGLRLTYVYTYKENGQRRWVGIARSGNWANRLFIRSSLSAFAQDAQSYFDNEGKRLIHVSTWEDNGQRTWLGIARSGTWASRWWISPNLNSFAETSQDYFDDDGLRLTHLSTYVEGGQRRYIGIARSGSWANRWFFRKDLDSFNLEAQRLFDEDGLRLIQVEMLQ